MNYYNYANFFIGLLPLAWEKEEIFLPGKNLFRYTPTRVGKRKNLLNQLFLSGVYSHLRGKKSASASLFLPNMGTLLLAWEKDFYLLSLYRVLRATPTRVGKSADCDLWLPCCQVYSHSRGKKTVSYSYL